MIAEKSITLVKNEDSFLPFVPNKYKKVTHLLLSTDDDLRTRLDLFSNDILYTHSDVNEIYVNDPISSLGIKDVINKDCLTVCLLNCGPTYDVIASFSVYKENLEVDCDECFETLTFSETIQVDPDDEWVRCCTDCAKERNKE